MANVQVQALNGPQTSAEAEFVAHLGSRAHVPVLSYSTTSPSLSPLHTPFFVRTAAADCFQASPVTAVIVAFGWRVVAVIHEDSPYGVGILAPLADALGGAAAIAERVAVPRNAGDDALDAVLLRLMAMPTRAFVVHATYGLTARLFRRAREAGMMPEGYAWVATDGAAAIAERAAVPRNAGDDALDAVLLRLMAMPTRAFVVHATYGIMARLFRRAREAGMMPEGYAWVATDGVGCFLDRLHAEDVDAMQGVVTFRPHIEFTSGARNLSARFLRENLSEPTVSGLRAYDTAWVVAAAAESAFQSPPRMARPTPEPTVTKTELDRILMSARGAAFLRAVLHTTFDGMASRFTRQGLVAKVIWFMGVVEHQSLVKLVGYCLRLRVLAEQDARCPPVQTRALCLA